MRTVSEAIGEFSADTTYADLPAEVVAKVKLHIADAMASGIAGSVLSHSRAVQAYASLSGAPGDSTVLGVAARLTAESAALANATAIHGIECDDYHTGALAHPGCVAVPVGFALAEEGALTGQELISAVAVGMEITLRFGRAMMPSLIADRGFHETGVTGVFGAAAAAASAKRLSAPIAAQAIALAASHAAGTTEFTHGGGEVKRLHAGIAAGAGVRSAILAELGLDAPSTAIEGERGVLQAYTRSWNEAALTDRLGTWWDLLDTAIKPVATCGALIGPVGLLERILEEQKYEPADIDEVIVGLDATSLRHVGAAGAEPTDLVSAQMSARYSLGMTVAGRGNALTSYLRLQDGDFHDQEVIRQARKVRLVPYPEADLARPATMIASVTVRASDGREASLAGEAAGTPSLPLSAEQFAQKFSTLGSPTLGSDASDRLLDIILSIDDHSVRDLTDALTKGTS